MTDDSLSSHAHELDLAPAPAFAAQANGTAEMYEAAAADHEGFWAQQARERITWATDFERTLDWDDAPFAKWFVGGQLNVAYNCVDRHVEAGNGDRVAIHFEGEGGDTRTITYADLQREVSKTANALTELGVGTGDTVAVYMPMIPETVFTMLACARLGAPHSVIFGGFSAEALHTRIDDAQCKVVVTTDGQFRRGKPSPLKPAVDEALQYPNPVQKVLVVRRTETEVDWHEGRDVWWHDVVDRQADTHEAQPHDSEHPLFILYTSGTTGKPKGIFHTSGGYLTQAAYTNAVVHDVHPETDVYWCTADVGWVTGHSYIVYGPLANGATQVMYEGTPDTPHQGRWWELIEKYKVSILYTAPTAIRTFMKWGDDIPAKFDLSSVRVLGSVGEPINPEAWLWYRKHIGGNTAPIVDTWWQTETGGILISPLPGAIDQKPGSATRPFFGVKPGLVDNDGQSLEGANEGNLVLNDSWPGQMRTVFGDHQRYIDTYFRSFPGRYFTGDGARRDADGYYWITGRVDDVLNVAGHRLGTAEIESALVAHARVAEAAVVGCPHDIKGQGIYAYVTLVHDAEPTEELRKELREWVRREIGPIATPDHIQWAPGLPKTRSGKIMRRILRKIAANEHEALGDISTLADPGVVAQLVDNRMVRS